MHGSYRFLRMRYKQLFHNQNITFDVYILDEAEIFLTFQNKNGAAAP